MIVNGKMFVLKISNPLTQVSQVDLSEQDAQ